MRIDPEYTSDANPAIAPIWWNVAIVLLIGICFVWECFVDLIRGSLSLPSRTSDRILMGSDHIDWSRVCHNIGSKIKELNAERRRGPSFPVAMGSLWGRGLLPFASHHMFRTIARRKVNAFEFLTIICRVFRLQRNWVVRF